ncbi:MAG: sulfite exporter TauE/SafE family protein [Candidatus Aureabacteria bacterium]|nr:sulfite exporter TauE/SafE family protein [Candidatus Auribacterota bacterium]
METVHILILLTVGFIAGIINVMAGGGSLLTIPTMIFMGLDGATANGTNRIAILVQCITATIKFFKKGFSDFKLSITLSLCALPGTFVGALLGTKIHGILFNRILACVMFMILILMSQKTSLFKKKKETVPTKKRFVIAHILMLIAGFYGGFIQAGVGFILILILHRILGLDLVRVNMHKVFIVGTYSFLAVGIFIWKGNIAWLQGVVLAIGNSIGSWFGVNIAVKGGEKIIRKVFYVALIILGLRLLLF